MSLLGSYPFISFDFSTAQLTPKCWLWLGEAMTKAEHLSGIPLDPSVAADMMRVYLARGVQATTAIEGNTLSLDQVENIMAGHSEQMAPSREYQAQEVRNIQEAISDIDQALIRGQRFPITVERLKALNSLVLRGTPQAPEVEPGRLRSHNVGVNRYRAPDARDVPVLLEGLVDWLGRIQAPASSAREDRFVAAVLAAVLAHLYLAWIHPFGNGNGRVARLIEVQILSESGVIPVVATNVLSNHYNLTRDHYYQALDAARQDVVKFISYSLQGFVDGLREQVADARRESRRVHWESYVHGVFARLPGTPARSRQRTLALSMPEHPITPEEATELTPRLARLYAVAGDRTPARDLNGLAKLGLVVKNRRRYTGNSALVDAFIPPVSGPLADAHDGSRSEPVQVVPAAAVGGDGRS